MKQKIAVISSTPVTKKIISLLEKSDYEVIQIVEPEQSLDILQAIAVPPQILFDCEIDKLAYEQMERSGEVRTDFSNPKGLRRLLHRRNR